MTEEVYKSIADMIKNKNVKIYLNPQDQNLYEDKTEVMVVITIKTDYDIRKEGAIFLFKQTEQGWKLVEIKPKLQDIKLTKSFEEEIETKIKKIPKSANLF